MIGNKLSALAVASSLGFMIQPACAVIVGGTNGDGLNNAGESTLQGYLSSVSDPAFPYWGNLIRYSDASGIYLGYNPVTMQGWVLSANHITETTSITVSGHNYAIIDPNPGDPNQNGTRVVAGSINTDLVLYKFSVGGGNPVPPLPTVPISGNAASVNELLVMAGRGMRSGAGTISENTVLPYAWGTPGTSDTVPFRWGSNVVEAINLTDGAGAYYFATDFDSPGTGTAFDGQAALGDSGGSGFILRGGQWWLAGLMVSVDDGPDADIYYNPAGYGDYTYLADLYPYRSEIATITGSLIPEPSVGTLLAGMVFILLKRRRIARD
jgi:hypothetical protein